MQRNRSKRAVLLARTYRRKMGMSEKLLWRYLRRKTMGFRFRRQYAIGPYILDFYCPEVKVCVEVDGEVHRRKNDKRRDVALDSSGILTIRIPTFEIFSNLEGVLEEICRVCRGRIQRPPP